jgi:hypothetical protein
MALSVPRFVTEGHMGSITVSSRVELDSAMKELFLLPSNMEGGGMYKAPTYFNLTSDYIWTPEATCLA